MNSITVMSRSRALAYVAEATSPIVIVSINDHGSYVPDFADNPYIEDICYLFFDDVETEEEGGMTRDDAEEILAFAKDHLDADVECVVHCGAGRSRSAGVAAALMLLVFGDDADIFDSPVYSPNMHCYRYVLDAAGLGYVDDEVDAKEAHQHELWIERAKANGLI